MVNIKEEDRQKFLSTIEESFKMYEKTKRDTVKNMRAKLSPDGKKMYDEDKINEEIELINNAQNDLFMKYEFYGGNPEDLAALAKEVKKPGRKKKVVEQPEEELDYIEAIVEKKEEQKKKGMAIQDEYVEIPYPEKNSGSYNEAYDMIPLPSNGECYKSKISRMPVAYITAYDENMIIAPNLYRDNKFIDLMLKHKVLSDIIDVGDLIEGDRDAILLFLRLGYGNDYPITATDGNTGKEFDAVVDLSKLKYKEFKLKGDDNGWFDFKLPVSGKDIKFKFLTHNDIVTLERMSTLEENRLIKNKLKEFVEEMDEFVESDTESDVQMKNRVRQAIRTIETWEEELDEDRALDFSHNVTNRLERCIMSVDGITDRKYIRDFVRNMNVRDSSALRKYINSNEPGIDYNITIEKPLSLGGGSMTVFLQLDQYLFLNVSE